MEMCNTKKNRAISDQPSRMPVQRDVDEGKWLLAESQKDVLGYVFDPKKRTAVYYTRRHN